MNDDVGNQLANIPNSYIFTLDNGKFALVEAPFGMFHTAYAALVQHFIDVGTPLLVTESHPWKPTNIGYSLMHSNGELEVKLKLA